VRKYKNKLVIKPAKEGIKALRQKARECIKSCLGQTAETLIAKLNPIRGFRSQGNQPGRKQSAAFALAEPDSD